MNEVWRRRLCFFTYERCQCEHTGSTDTQAHILKTLGSCSYFSHEKCSRFWTEFQVITWSWLSVFNSTCYLSSQTTVEKDKSSCRAKNTQLKPLSSLIVCVLCLHVCGRRVAWLLGWSVYNTAMSVCLYVIMNLFMYMRCVRHTARVCLCPSVCVCEWVVFASVINPGQTTEAL